MNKTIRIYLLIAMIIAGMFFFTGFISQTYAFNFIFIYKTHVLLEILTVILLLLIFIKVNSLFNKSHNAKAALIAGGFLSGFLLELHHLIAAKSFPYDVLSLNNALDNPDLFYILIGRLFIPICLFSSIFFDFKQNETEQKKLRNKIYIGFLFSTFIIIFLDYMFNHYLLSFVKPHIGKMVIFSNSLEVINNAIYLLIAFIFLDMKIEKKLNIASFLIAGLLVFGTEQLFFLVPLTQNGIFGFFTHIVKIIGFILIYLGIEDAIKPSFYLFKHKLISYLSLFLIMSYFIFVSLTSTLFNLVFPAFSSFLFLESFIFSIIIQYKLLENFVNPIENIILGISKYKPEEEFKKIQIESNDEIGLLAEDINYLIESNQKYIKELILNQKKEIKNSAKQELLRKLSNQIRSELDINLIKQRFVFEYGKILGAQRSFFCEYDLYKKNFLPPDEYSEYLDNPTVLSIKKADSAFLNQFLSLFNEISLKKKIVILNSEDYIKEFNFKNKAEELNFKKYKISSAIILPLIFKNQLYGAYYYDFDRENAFEEDEMKFTELLIEQAAIAIHQSKLLIYFKKIAEREAFLKLITNKILMASSIEESMYSLSKEIAELFNAEKTCLRMFDPVSKGFMDSIAEYNTSKDHSCACCKIKDYKIFDDFIKEELFSNNQSIIIDNIDKSDFSEKIKAIFKKINFFSGIIFPIRYLDNPIAIIIISNSAENKNFKKDNYELLIPLSEQIGISARLFQLNENLTNSLNAEKLIKDLIIEARELEDPTVIINTLLQRMKALFHSDKALTLSIDKANKISINNLIDDTYTDKLFFDDSVDARYIISYFKKHPQEALTINNVELEIDNISFKDYLIKNDIKAFIAYRINISSNQKEVQPTVKNIIMICSNTTKNWKSEDIETFKMIVNSGEIILFQIMQKIEIEDTKKTFLATLTHDLRSPIYAEQKALEFIISRKGETPLSDFCEYLQDIYNTNEELLRIVNNILMVYHYESGKNLLNTEPNDIREIIEYSVRSMQPLALAQNSYIDINLEEKMPFVLANKDEIIRVIINLISNAIKHNHSETNIIVSARKAKEYIEISIKDNGKGIPDDARDKIFQRYPTQKRQIGTGLGLYLSKQIVEAHNGKIWFETKEGEGTTFCFTLPVLN
ncbi:MAG: ATP-binding protein [bacterium]